LKKLLIAKQTNIEEDNIEFTKILLALLLIYIFKKFLILNLENRSKLFLTIDAKLIFFAKFSNFFASISKTQRILFVF